MAETQIAAPGGNNFLSSNRRNVFESWYFSLLAGLRSKKAKHIQLHTFLGICDMIQFWPFAIFATPSWSKDIFDAAGTLASFQLRGAVARAGYDAFRAVFWSCVVLTLVCVCTLVWVSFSHVLTTPRWLVRLSRRLVLIVGFGFFTSLLGVFLEPWNCSYAGASSAATALLVTYPHVQCWEAGNAGLAVIGLLASIVLLGLAATAMMITFDPDHRSVQPAAMASVRAAALLIAARTVLVITSMGLRTLGFWLSVVIFGCLAGASAYFIGDLPFYSHVNNVAMGAALASLTGASAVQLMAELIDRPGFAAWPYLLTASTVGGAVIGAVLATNEITRLSGTALDTHRRSDSGFALYVARKFSDPIHIEIALRYLRAIIPDEAALELGAAILRAGQEQFPDDTDVLLTAANHQLAYSTDASLALNALERVQRLRPNFVGRYIVFLRDQEGQQRRARAAGSDSAMDLATYVEFQAQFKLASRAHHRVLRKVHEFWRLVHMANLNDDAAKLTDSMSAEQVDEAEAAAAVGDANVLAELQANPASPSSPFGQSTRSIGTSLTADSEGQGTMSRFISRLRASVSRSSRSGGDWGSESPGIDPASPVRIRRTGSFRLRTGKRWFDKKALEYMPPRLAASLARVIATEHSREDPSVMQSSFVERLAECCHSIDALAADALRTYAELLERYPRSSRLLRGAARFHLQVTHDVREADRMLAEADHLDESAAEDAEQGMGREGFFGVTSMVDDSADSLVIIDSRGTMLSVNTNCRRMFGYSESELIGKNVSMLCPPEHAVQHSSYLSNYQTTGVAKVMGSTRRLEGRRRDGTTFPIELAVSRVDSPQGVTFAGVIHALPEDDGVANITIDTHGKILAVNQTFGRMFGWVASEAIGRNIKAFMPRRFAKHHDDWLARFRRTGRSVAVGVQGRRLEGLHRNGMVFPISIEITVVKTGNTQMYVGKITELLNAAGVLTINEKGNILSCNKMALNLFGYRAQSELVGRNVTRLMPEPYASFHSKYLQRFLEENKGRIVGGPGRYVTALHADGTQFPIHLKVTEIKTKRGEGRRFAGEITIMNQVSGITGDDGEEDRNVDAGESIGAADPLLGRITINGAGIIRYANTVAANMFGWPTDALSGKNVSVLMPADIAARHDGFLQRYAATGAKKVIGSVGRHLMGQHTAGYLFPIALTVEEEIVGGQIAYHGSIRALSDIEGILHADLHGKILSVNAGLCYLLGYRASELEGANVKVLMPSTHRKNHDGYLARFRETGEARFSGTRQFVPVRHADGSKLAAQLEVAVIKHAEYGRCLCARMTAAPMDVHEAESSVKHAVDRANGLASAKGTTSESETDAHRAGRAREFEKPAETQRATGARGGRKGVGFAEGTADEPSSRRRRPLTPLRKPPARVMLAEEDGGEDGAGEASKHTEGPLGATKPASESLHRSNPVPSEDGSNDVIADDDGENQSTRLAEVEPDDIGNEEIAPAGSPSSPRPRTRSRAMSARDTEPPADDLQYVFSDRSGNAISFVKAAEVLGFAKVDADGPDPWQRRGSVAGSAKGSLLDHAPGPTSPGQQGGSAVPIAQSQSAGETVTDTQADGKTGVSEDDLMYDTKGSGPGGDAASERGDDDSESRASSGSAVNEIRRVRHRLRQLKRLRRHQAVRARAVALTRTIVVCMLLMASTVIVMFALARHFTQQLLESIGSIESAAARAAQVQDVAALARALQLAAAASDNTSWALANSRLKFVRARAVLRHQDLYLGFSARSSALRQHYVDQPLTLLRYLPTTVPPSYQQSQVLGFWTAANMFFTSATALISPVNTTTITAAPLFMEANTWPGIASALSASADFRFVVDNSATIMEHALLSTNLHVAQVMTLSRYLHNVQLITLILELCLPILLVAFVVRPSYLKLHRERALMYGLYSIVPRSLSAKLARIRGRAKEEEQDSEDDDSDSASTALDDGEDDDGQMTTTGDPEAARSSTSESGALRTSHSTRSLSETRSRHSLFATDDDDTDTGCKNCCSGALAGVGARLAFYLRLLGAMLKRGLVAVHSIDAPLFRCRTPLTMPQKAGYATLTFMVLVAINHSVVSTHLSALASQVDAAYLAGVSGAFAARVRLLSQELLYENLRTPMTASPAPVFAASQGQQSDFLPSLRASVWLGQAAFTSLVQGHSLYTDTPGTGDGFLYSGTEMLPSAAVHGNVSVEQALQLSLLSAGDGHQLASKLFDVVGSPSVAVRNSNSPLRAVLFGPGCQRSASCDAADIACTLLQGASALTGVTSEVTLPSVAGSDYTPVIPVADPTSCVPETHPLAPFSLYGLDTSLRAVFRQAWALTQETPADLVPTNPRAPVLQHVASYDVQGALGRLHGAVQSACTSALVTINLSESLLFIAYLVCGAACYYYFFKPFSASLSAEAARAGALLSFLPPNIDVRKLVSLYHARMRGNGVQPLRSNAGLRTTKQA